MTMSLDLCLAKASDKIDDVLAGKIVDLEDMLKSHGATTEEIENELAIWRQQWAVWKAEQMDRLREWLQPGGEVLH